MAPCLLQKTVNTLTCQIPSVAKAMKSTKATTKALPERSALARQEAVAGVSGKSDDGLPRPTLIRSTLKYTGKVNIVTKKYFILVFKLYIS